MAVATKRTVSLPVEKASYIDSLVESGAYASESEVVLAGLEALQDRNQVIEQWLINDVLPVVEAMEADSRRGIPIEDVIETLRVHHAKQSDDAAR